MPSLRSGECPGLDALRVMRVSVNRRRWPNSATAKLGLGLCEISPGADF